MEQTNNHDEMNNHDYDNQPTSSKAISKKLETPQQTKLRPNLPKLAPNQTPIQLTDFSEEETQLLSSLTQNLTSKVLTKVEPFVSQLNFSTQLKELLEFNLDSFDTTKDYKNMSELEKLKNIEKTKDESLKKARHLGKSIQELHSQLKNYTKSENQLLPGLNLSLVQQEKLLEKAKINFIYKRRQRKEFFNLPLFNKISLKNKATLATKRVREDKGKEVKQEETETKIKRTE